MPSASRALSHVQHRSIFSFSKSGNYGSCLKIHDNVGATDAVRRCQTHQRIGHLLAVKIA